MGNAQKFGSTDPSVESLSCQFLIGLDFETFSKESDAAVVSEDWETRRDVYLPVAFKSQFLDPDRADQICTTQGQMETWQNNQGSRS